MDSPVRILYVEDELNDVELVRTLLSQGGVHHEMLRVQTRDEYLAALEDDALDLILSDYSLPSFDGLSALALAKQLRPDVPFILVSGTLGEELAIESMRAGATDYVLKQRNTRLVPAVTRALREAHEHRQHLHASQELRRLATAIENTGEAIVLTDTRGNIQYVNPAFESITGFAREDAVGQNMRLLKSGKQDLAFYNHMWNTIASGQVWSGHFTNMKKDGSLYEEEATISPVRDDGGEVISYVAVKQDVTERMELERRARQAQKLEALGTLAGGIAHDFNNILAAITGYGQLAAGSLPEDSPELADLEQVLEAADRAKNLVRQILTFSQQREGKREPVRLHLILEEALRLLRPGLPATIDIQRDLDQDCGPVYADPTQMHQVIMNLCTNAYHAMKESGGTLSVALACVQVSRGLVDLHPGLHEGSYAKLTVKDTGHGMGRETMDRIFDPFFTTKNEDEGTGMGLSTTYGIVKACGGAISVDSEPGKGTTFDAYLPLAESAPQEQKPESEPVRRGTERILVVDDEENLAEVIARQLQSLGYDVTVKTSSHAALKDFRARPQHFDLVITDDVMPNMTGRQLIREVTLLRKDIPVISISGDDRRPSPGEGTEQRARAFLHKPFTRRSLASAVRDALDKTKVSGVSPVRATDSCARRGEMML